MLTQYEKLRAVEKEIAAEPIFEYAYLRTENLKFSERVRDICREECPRYNKSWSCPPAVGTVDECRARALGYKDCFVFTTIAELDNPTDMAEALESRSEHQKVTVKVSKVFEKYYGQVLTLSVESCSLCDKCTYPERAAAGRTGCFHVWKDTGCWSPNWRKKAVCLFIRDAVRLPGSVSSFIMPYRRYTQKTVRGNSHVRRG